MMKKEVKEGGVGRAVEKERELWARLDELEREEEEYLAKERERELAAAAANKLNEEERISDGDDKPTARTKFCNVSEEGKHVTANIKEGPEKSRKLAAASGPLRITVKHTPSKDTATPARAKTVWYNHSIEYVEGMMILLVNKPYLYD